MKPLRIPLRRSSSCWRTSATRISLLSSTARSWPGGYSLALAQVMTTSEPFLPGLSSNVELSLHQRSACFSNCLSLTRSGGAIIVFQPENKLQCQQCQRSHASSPLHVSVVSNGEPVTDVTSSCTGISWHPQTTVPYTAMHLQSATTPCLPFRVHYSRLYLGI